MWTANGFVKMLLVVSITLKCGVTGVDHPTKIADPKSCSGTAQYIAFCPRINTPAVLESRTDLSDQISINSKRVPITYSSAYANTFNEKLVPSITRNRAPPFVLVTQLKSYPLFSLHCLLIV